jgi:signal transduction histidine kinase/ActR/RegA family two-component response regulator
MPNSGAPSRDLLLARRLARWGRRALPLVAHILREDADLLTRWRARLTAAFLASVGTLGVGVAVPMVTFAINRRLWPLAAFDATALLVTYYLIFSRRVSNRVRMVFLTGASFGLGVMSVLTRGPGSTVLGWLFMSAFLAAFLLGPRATAGVVIATLGVLGGVALAIARAWVPWAAGNPLALSEWLLTSLNFSFLIVVFAIANSLIIRLLEKEDRARSMAEQRLRDARHNEALGTLAGGIAHDFNNLLVPVLANVETVRALVPAGSEADQALRDAERSANRARELVQRILTFGRGMNASRGPIDPAQSAREAVELARPSVPPDVRLTLTTQEATTVRASVAELHQIFANLIANAVHAVGTRGEIEVRVDSIESSGTPSVRIQVRDDGTGMDAATRERLFDPYFSTKGPGRGTGLGLPIVQSIVLSLGGTIQVQSALQEGTTFTIMLPAYRAATHRDSPAPVAIPPREPASGTRVLLVDDEPTVRRAATRVLESMGCTVASAESAREALTHINPAAASFDVLVTDFRMPGMSGVELAAAMEREGRQLPVVLVSGHLDAARTEAQIPAHIVLLAKPFTRAALAEAITTAMAGAPRAN